MDDRQFRRAEKFLFYGLILFYSLPVLSSRFFPTLDGPAHLYNANLITNILFHPEGVSAGYFEFSGMIEPNMLGHIFFAVFNLFLPSFLAEKITLLFYLAGFPFFFRMVIKKMFPHGIFVSWLVFPFIHSFLFYLGFFNFSLGVMMTFVTVYFWLNKSSGVKKTTLLMVLFFISYLSHLFSFFLGIFIIAGLILADWIREKKIPRRDLLIVSVSSLPAAILSLIFILKKSDGSVETGFSVSELFSDLLAGRPLVTLDFPTEIFYSSGIASILFLFFITAFFFRFRSATFRLVRSDIFLLLSVVMLILYFIVPDSSTSGGFISPRLSLFFFLLLIIWLSAQKIPLRITVLFLSFYLALGSWFVLYHTANTKKFSVLAESFHKLSDKIPDGSIVLPLNYSDYWYFSNFASYAGTEKEIVILDNYEASKPHFPLTWKAGVFPGNLGNHTDSRQPCVNIPGYEKSSGKIIGFITLFDFKMPSDSCAENSVMYIFENYTIVDSSQDGRVKLFRRK